MRVSCLQDNLARGLNIVSRAVSPRSPMPVLANVLLATDNGRLRLSATDTKLGIVAWIGASVEEDGEITVPARTLNDLVNTLSPERVDMEVNVRNSTLNLACGATTAKIKGIDAQDFPIMPEPSEDDDWLAVPPDILRNMIAKVVFAAARDESRPILTGVLLNYEDGLLTMAAADGFRLAVEEVALEGEFYESFSLVIPARALNELLKVSGDETEDIQLVLPRDRSQVIFRMSSIDLSEQLLSDGVFPDYHQIIPTDLTTRTIVDTADLLRACKRADIFAREANHTVRLSVEPQDGAIGVIKVSAAHAETGENEVVLDATIEGDGLDISFNVRYLIDMLGVIHQDRIMLGLTESNKPGLFRPTQDESYTYVVMPMQTGR